MNRNKGFTLVEVLLSLSIGTIVLAIVFQTVAYGMRIQKSVYQKSAADVLNIQSQLSTDLLGAFVSRENHSEIIFVGGSSSLKFISTVYRSAQFNKVINDDVWQVRYQLQFNENIKANQLVVDYQTVVHPDAINQEGLQKEISRRILSNVVSNLRFEYFDGESWQISWQSFNELPKAIRLTIAFSDDEDVGKNYTTIIPLIDS